ncbi:conserved hypothetical protein [Methylobacterium sp. 4-46]|uniref:DUF3341 domain-containing protein n=1 Tax=unclassified Methylobacterium TaxID=2615210 RepID=UPI000165CD97|nr:MULTISPECIES: DUF3341 domain-containing protein [Methylobacterium]ACA20109.1 conserved hypothetical protein [Methylobacterium sp. 4-46]WFT79292.1 DUF3341 domain-containing protein [Methylobacterium nodulans]
MGEMLACFADPHSLVRAARTLRARGHRPLDTFTPYPVEAVEGVLDPRPSRLRWAMLAGGVGAAAFAYLLQWYAAVIDYPLNSGGRPLHSWPVFLLVPFEVGVFAAALAGLLAFLWGTGLPRLHHPLFAVPGFERASQDRFFLLAAAAAPGDGTALRHLLEETGALVVFEVRP